jgi:hypothetical protein
MYKNLLKRINLSRIMTYFALETEMKVEGFR